MLCKEMERLHSEVERGCITGGQWNPSVSPAALRNILRAKGVVEGPTLEVRAHTVGNEYTVSYTKKVCAKGTAALLGSLPPGSLKVHHLDLTGADVEDEAAELLARELEANIVVAQLTLFCFSESCLRLLAGALQRASGRTRLRSLRLGNIVDGDCPAAVAAVVAACDSLEVLCMAAGCSGSAGGLRALMAAIAAHPTLSSVELTQFPLNAAGAKTFGNALRGGQQLRKISLPMSLHNAAAALALAPALRHAAPWLTHLCMPFNPFGDKGAAEVAAALSVASCALVSVELTACHIGVAGVEALAAALRVNSSLTKIDVGGNERMGDKGARALFGALRVNRTLALLDVSDNGIKSAASLAGALEANRALKVLNFSGNPIMHHGSFVPLLAALVRPGCALTALDMSNCELELFAGTGRALATALAANTSLTTFRFCEDMEPDLSDIMSRNRRLRENEVAQRNFCPARRRARRCRGSPPMCSASWRSTPAAGGRVSSASCTSSTACTLCAATSRLCV